MRRDALKIVHGSTFSDVKLKTNPMLHLVVNILGREAYQKVVSGKTDPAPEPDVAVVTDFLTRYEG